MGRPNWTRSSACSRASPSMVRDAPHQLVGQGPLPGATAAGHAARGRSDRGGRHVGAGDLDDAEAGIEAVHGAQLEVGGADHGGDALPPRSGDDDRPVAGRHPGQGQSAHADALALHRPRRVRAPQRGQHDAEVALEAEAEGLEDHGVERRRRGARRALQLEQERDRGAPVGGQRLTPAELAEGGVERATRCWRR